MAEICRSHSNPRSSSQAPHQNARPPIRRNGCASPVVQSRTVLILYLTGETLPMSRDHATSSSRATTSMSAPRAGSVMRVADIPRHFVSTCLILLWKTSNRDMPPSRHHERFTVPATRSGCSRATLLSEYRTAPGRLPRGQFRRTIAGLARLIVAQISRVADADIRGQAYILADRRACQPILSDGTSARRPETRAGAKVEIGYCAYCSHGKRLEGILDRLGRFPARRVTALRVCRKSCPSFRLPPAGLQFCLSPARVARAGSDRRICVVRRGHMVRNLKVEPPTCHFGIGQTSVIHLSPDYTRAPGRLARCGGDGMRAVATTASAVRAGAGISSAMA